VPKFGLTETLFEKTVGTFFKKVFEDLINMYMYSSTEGTTTSTFIL